MSTLPALPNGIFISFEGIDGAGKSTHIAALSDAITERLAGSGRHVVLTREPGGTPLAETLRELVLHQSMDPLTEALLIFAARRDHLQNVIEPALARGDVVLCDRFTDATFAYQGAGRGFDLQVLAQLETWVQSQGSQLRQPDMTVWFDLPAQVAAKRLAGARVPDRFEAQPEAFFARVSGGYAQRAEQDPVRFARINADQAPQAVRTELMAAVRARGWIV
jgi:dTMP kinase